MAYFSQQRHIDGDSQARESPRKRRKMLLRRTFWTILQAFLSTTASWMPTHKNKTLATALAFLLGGLGVHRFYLKNSTDRLGLLHLCSLPAAGLVYGLGHAPNPFWP